MTKNLSQAEILFVVGTLEVGGTERHLTNVARSLVKRGWQTSLYSLAGNGPLRAELEAGGVAVHVAPIQRCGKRRSYLFRRFALGVEILNLIFVMIRRRPAIIHFFLPAAYLIGAPLAILSRLPIRVMSRRSLNQYQRLSPYTRRMEQVLHRSMTAILGNSWSIIRELQDEGVPTRRLGLIYGGIDTSRFAGPGNRSSVRAALEIGPSELILVIVANLIPYKGHADLIEALARARAGLPDGWHLLIVGRDDGIANDLRAQAARHGIEKNILFLGLRSDVPEILLASDIGILCSHEEGFSNALLEGMAAGLPMIATDVGGNPEAIEDGVSGLIVPPRDPQRLADAIVRLANDPPLRAALGEAARRRIAENFGFEYCVQSYDLLYRALLSGAAPQDVEQIRVRD
jgi:glycosyltransferase involved in cell wall biosynthesis